MSNYLVKVMIKTTKMLNKINEMIGKTEKIIDNIKKFHPEKIKEKEEEEKLKEVLRRLIQQLDNNIEEISLFISEGNDLIIDSNVWMDNYSFGLKEFLDLIIESLNNHNLCYYMYDFQLSEIKNKESDKKSGENAREGMRKIKFLQKKYKNIKIIESNKKIFFDDFVVSSIKEKKGKNKTLVITYDKELVIRLNSLSNYYGNVFCLDYEDVNEFFSLNPYDKNFELIPELNLKKLSLR